MHLDERRHPERLGDLGEVLEVLVGEHRGDEENRVRAVLARQVDLVRVDDELLAQERARDAGLTDELEVLERSLEVLLVGEHGQARGAAGFVRLGNLHRVEIGLDDAFGRGRLLDLGDEPGLAGGLPLVLDGADEVARGFLVLDRGADQGERELLLLLGEPLVLVPHDLLQDVLGLVRLVVDALALLVDGLHLERELVGADVVPGLAERRAAADGHLRLGLRDGRRWGHGDGAAGGLAGGGARAAAEVDGRAESGGGRESGHASRQLCADAIPAVCSSECPLGRSGASA